MQAEWRGKRIARSRRKYNRLNGGRLVERNIQARIFLMRRNGKINTNEERMNKKKEKSKRKKIIQRVCVFFAQKNRKMGRSHTKLLSDVQIKCAHQIYIRVVLKSQPKKRNNNKLIRVSFFKNNSLYQRIEISFFLFVFDEFAYYSPDLLFVCCCCFCCVPESNDLVLFSFPRNWENRNECAEQYRTAESWLDTHTKWNNYLMFVYARCFFCCFFSWADPRVDLTCVLF